MFVKRVLRLVGALMILNGLSGFIFGKAFIRLFQRKGGFLGASIAWLLSWPDWLLRFAGLCEALLGSRVLVVAPFRVEDMYRILAPFYDPVLLVWNVIFAKVETTVNRAVTDHLPSGGRILDLGCGTGANLARIERLRIPFSKYVGIDLTKQMLARARHKFGHLPNVAFLSRDLLSDPLPDGEFDLIISTWVFSHLKGRSAEVVEKAMGRLKPGGHTIILMLSQSGSWLDLPVKILARPFLIEPVLQNTYRSFPDQVALHHFWGGMVSLAVLGKEK